MSVRVPSSNCIIDLDALLTPEAEVAGRKEEPRFAVPSGRMRGACLADDFDDSDPSVLRHAGGSPAVLADLLVGGAPGAFFEVAVEASGFNMAIGARVVGTACSDLTGGSVVPHYFPNGVALTEAGEWVQNGRCLRALATAYDTFRDGDLILARVTAARGLEVSRVRNSVVRDLGAVHLGRDAAPYVMLRGLDEARIRLVNPRPPWSSSARASYPLLFNDALDLVEHQAATLGSSLPLEITDLLASFLAWHDFFPRA